VVYIDTPPLILLRCGCAGNLGEPMSEELRKQAERRRQRRKRQREKATEEATTGEDTAGYRSDVEDPTELDEPYAAGTVLTKLFGDHPEVKLVASLLSEPDSLLDKSELAQLAGVSRKSVHEHIDTLVDFGVAHPADSVGQITLYELPDTPVVTLLHNVEDYLVAIERTREADQLPESWGSDPTATSDDRQDGAALDEPYADDTPLPLLFGAHPEPKLVAALISEPETRLNVTDISRIAGVGRTTVYGHLDQLHTYGLLQEAGTVGNSQQYTVPEENPLVDALRDLELAILEQKRA